MLRNGTTSRVVRLVALLVLVAWALPIRESSAALPAAALPRIWLPAVSNAAGSLPPYPAALPRTFLLGLGNQPSELDWMTNSGIPWQARYCYLAGGVNTGASWTTWNSPAGAYATYYLQASAGAGYLPVFTYYQLLQSLPHQGSTEAEQDLSNLNNPSTMAAYFGEWKLLMSLAGSYGKPVLVHVEPDFWGYAQQIYGDDASATPAAVAASGDPEVQGFPNTAAGFAQALVHLRDLYAPNVILAYHVSPWAVDGDLGTSKTAIDVQAKAQRDASFFRSLRASFDLLFYDLTDRDAGYYQDVVGDGGAHWWDPTNATLPNFDRFAQWIGYVTQGTGKRGMLWQVPLGNQIYDTENNTWDHYQDNRVEYFLGPSRAAHLAQYASAGVVGILFGRGADGQSDYLDSDGDGVTNPPPIDGNTAVATFPDDDGGYLRQQATAYYQGGGIVLP